MTTTTNANTSANANAKHRERKVGETSRLANHYVGTAPAAGQVVVFTLSRDRFAVTFLTSVDASTEVTLEVDRETCEGLLVALGADIPLPEPPAPAPAEKAPEKAPAEAPEKAKAKKAKAKKA